MKLKLGFLEGRVLRLHAAAAGPSGAEDYFHFTCRGGDGSELQDCLAGGLFGEVLRRFFQSGKARFPRAASS